MNKVRSSFRRTGAGTHDSTISRSTLSYADEGFMNDDFRMLSGQSAGHIPLWKHERIWIRWPAKAIKAFESFQVRPVNILIPLVPFGFGLGYSQQHPALNFVVNLLALVPLAAHANTAIDELSACLGPLAGGTIAIIGGGTVPTTMGVVGVLCGEIRLVQANMIGTVICNLLWILGSCLVCGGYNHLEQEYSALPSTAATLVCCASVALFMPTTIQAISGGSVRPRPDISYPISIILLVLFFLYVFFALKSHARLYEDEDDYHGHRTSSSIRSRPIGVFAAFVLIVASTALCSMYLIQSTSLVSKNWNLSKTFIGAIILPVVSHSAEQVANCKGAANNMLNLVAGIAFGNSLNVLLLTTPVLVLLGWITGEAMTLQFKMFEVVVLILTVILISNIVRTGKSNYLSGAMCLGLYINIALAFYLHGD